MPRTPTPRGPPLTATLTTLTPAPTPLRRDRRRGAGRPPADRARRRDPRRHEAIRRRHRGRPDGPAHRPRLVLQPPRPVGLRQDDDAADDRRLRAADRAARSCSPASPSPACPPYRRNVNTVFQHYALFPHMDVAQNVGYGLRQKKVVARPRRRAGSARRSTWCAWGLRGRRDVGDVRRPAAARRARPRARQPSDGAAPRRAARRARPASSARRCRSSSRRSSARSGSRSST